MSSTIELARTFARFIAEGMQREPETDIFRGARINVVCKGLDGGDRVECIEIEMSDKTRFCLYPEVRSLDRGSEQTTEADPDLFSGVKPPPETPKKRKAKDKAAHDPVPPTAMDVALHKGSTNGDAKRTAAPPLEASAASVGSHPCCLCAKDVAVELAPLLHLEKCKAPELSCAGKHAVCITCKPKYDEKYGPKRGEAGEDVALAWGQSFALEGGKLTLEARSAVKLEALRRMTAAGVPLDVADGAVTSFPLETGFHLGDLVRRVGVLRHDAEVAKAGSKASPADGPSPEAKGWQASLGNEPPAAPTKDPGAASFGASGVLEFDHGDAEKDESGEGETVPAAPAKRKGRPKGSKNKPKGESAPEADNAPA